MRLGRCFAAAVAQMSMWSSIVVGDFAILPPAFELHGRESIQRVIVVASGQQTKSTGNQLPEYGSLVQSDEMTLRSSDESVIRVEDEIVYPVGGGMANVEAWLAGHIVASATVRVDAMHLPHQWSFRNEVQSVLARQGCNMGACHGALAGKGGFRLSLRGYDADADYFTIAREVRGRRIEIADPGRSLLVAKPTGALPHKGGLRLDVNSRDYRVVSQWIADGAVGPSSDDARLTHLSVSPKQSRLRPSDQTRILVSAHYDDGRIVDVSHWAKFSATDEAVASVDDDGLVRVRGSGEAAVLVWFGSRVELARMTVPYDNAVPESVFAAAPKRNFIDEINLKQLQTLDLPPSPRVDDLAFLRRATIDTVGRLPTAAEQRRFSNELA
ncbi:MAG: S-layer protein, partial [Planctomycetota bacterium]